MATKELHIVAMLTRVPSACTVQALANTLSICTKYIFWAPLAAIPVATSNVDHMLGLAKFTHELRSPVALFAMHFAMDVTPVPK